MAEFKKCRTSKEMMRHILLHHYITWWGVPIQATTYSMSKWDFYQKLVKLIDTAVAEGIFTGGNAHGYHEFTEKQMRDWK